MSLSSLSKAVDFLQVETSTKATPSTLRSSSRLRVRLTGAQGHANHNYRCPVSRLHTESVYNRGAVIIGLYE